MGDIKKRVLEGAKYMVNNKATIREVAKAIGVSKTTVHSDIKDRLEIIDPKLKKLVDVVIENNSLEGRVRGGMASKFRHKSQIERKEKIMDIIEVKNKEGQLVVSSREVAENFKRRHSDVINAVEKHIKELDESGNGKIRRQMFTKYEFENRGKKYPEYLMDRDGFSLLVMSFNNTKGVLEWKLKYIDAFNKMEEQVRKQIDPFQGLSKELQAIFSIDKKQQEHEERIMKLENNTTVDYGQQNDLQNIAKKRVIEIVGGKDSKVYKDNSLRSKVFSSIWSGYKDYLSVNSYKNTTRKDFNKAATYLRNWKPQGRLLREVEQLNGQLVMS